MTLSQYLSGQPLRWVLILIPLPLLLSGYYVFGKIQTFRFLHQEMERIQTKACLLSSAKKKEAALLDPLQHTDPHYLDHLHSLHFLIPEIKRLESFLVDNPEEETLFKRLQFLKTRNQLLFSEGISQSCPQFKEVEEIQQYTVEMNEEDLKKLLSMIEGGTIWPYGPKEGKPLFVITEFSLTKRELVRDEKVFAVSMKLLKREGV